MFAYVVSTVNGSVDQYVIGTWNTLLAEGQPVITSVFILYIVVWGYLLWTGRSEFGWSDVFGRILTASIIYALLFSVPDLVVFVYNLATEVPAGIATTILTASGTLADQTSIEGALDEVLDRVWETFALMREQSGVRNPAPFFLGLLLVIITLLVVGFALFLIVLAKLAVAILLAVAPIFILLYLFTGTRGLFEGWLRQTISFALIPILLYGLLTLILGLMNHVSEPLVVSAQNGAIEYTQMAAHALVMLVSFLLVTQVLGWASGIAGGMTLATMGAGGAVGRTAGRLSARAAIGGARLGGRGATAGTQAGARGATALAAKLRSNRTAGIPRRS